MRAFILFKVITVIAAIICPTAGRPQSDIQSRILNGGAQFVQHPQGAQSYYLPPVVRNGQQQTQHNQQSINTAPAEQQIQLQIPIETNSNNEIEEKKIVLHLPSQQYHPVQSQLQYPQPPPRKHYKIILLRSPPAPTPPPQPIVPEIEEQTLIYVLVKKPDEPSVQDLEQIQQMQQDAIKFNKPEVFFIKYKGNEVQQPVQAPTVTSTSSSQSATIEEIIQRQLRKQQQQQQQYSESSNNNVRGQGYNYDTSRIARQLNDAFNFDVDESNGTAAVDTKIDEVMTE